MSKTIERWLFVGALIVCGIQLLLDTQVNAESFDGELDGPNVCKVLEKYKPCTHVFKMYCFQMRIFIF